MRADFTIQVYRVVRRDEGEDALDQIVLKGFSPAAETALASARDAGRGMAVGEDEDHRFDFLAGDQIVKDHVRHTALVNLASALIA